MQNSSHHLMISQSYLYQIETESEAYEKNMCILSTRTFVYIKCTIKVRCKMMIISLSTCFKYYYLVFTLSMHTITMHQSKIFLTKNIRTNDVRFKHEYLPVGSVPCSATEYAIPVAASGFPILYITIKIVIRITITFFEFREWLIILSEDMYIFLALDFLLSLHFIS